MTGKFNVNSIFILIAGLLLLAGTGFNQALAGAGDQTATGVITEAGAGSFTLRTEDGAKEAFNTGRETSYEPSDFRPREGDKVQVTYYPKEVWGRTVQAVSDLKLIKANPNFKEPPNPAVGTIKEAGRRAYSIYIPAIGTAWKFEIARGWEKIPQDWTPAAEDKVKVSYEKVPSRFTGKHVYQIKTMEKM